MPSAFRPQRRAGLTLVEILIALSMTLIVLGTMTAAFKVASEEMREGRALIELANRARIVEDHLRTDLGSVTVETRVYDGEVEPHGYFEYVEGLIRDSTFAASDSFQGDCDDVLAFTARSTDGILYRGRRKRAVDANGNLMVDGNGNLMFGPTEVIESSLAEIVWFTTVNDNDIDGAVGGPLEPQVIDGVTPVATSSVDFDDSIRLHRRVLLIRPEFGTLAPEVSLEEANNFIRNNDISVRLVPRSANRFDIVANSLEDLAIRANRFAHMETTFNGINEGNFPNNFTFTNIQNRVASDDNSNGVYTPGASTQPWAALAPILSDVGAFDLRVYSPTARVNDVASVIVEPSDVGYDNRDLNFDLPGSGAYVDLGYANADLATISQDGRQDEWFIATSNPPASGGWNGNVWDTWTPAYESDGIDQNGDGNVDEATNGVNNGGSNVIDDPGERETSPPYVNPIRGMKVTLRLVEKGTKQVHQVSIIHSFVPE